MTEQSAPPGQTVFTRRVALTGAIGATAYLCLPMSRAVADPSQSPLDIIGSTNTLLVSGTDAIVVPQVLGAQTTATGSAIPLGATFRLDFDPAIYERLSTPLVTVAGKPAQHSVTESSSSSVTVRVDEAVPLGEVAMVAVGVLRHLRYPEDGVRLGKPPQSVIQDPRSRTPAPRVTQGSARRQGAWGVEVSAHWDEVTWSRHFRTFIPTLVTVRSVGPASTPKRLRLIVRTDDRVRRGVAARILSPRSASIALADRRGGEVEFILSGRMGAEEEVTVILEGTQHTPSGSLAGFTHPMVTVSATGASPEQRTTGRETATRIDSVYDSSTWNALRVV